MSSPSPPVSHHPSITALKTSSAKRGHGRSPPSAKIAERIPWRKYEDLGYPGRGGLWQAQRHIYLAPFYYIDYTLAAVCAMQYRAWAERDRDEAMESYVALCKRGGEAPFQTLARGAGLVSPFDDGCLEKVVGETRAVLGV